MRDIRRVVEQIEGYVVDVYDSQIEIMVREKGLEDDYCRVTINEELAQTIKEQRLDFSGAPFLLILYSDDSYHVILDKSRYKPAEIDEETSRLLARLEAQDTRLRTNSRRMF